MYIELVGQRIKFKMKMRLRDVAGKPAYVPIYFSLAKETVTEMSPSQIQIFAML